MTGLRAAMKHRRLSSAMLALLVVGLGLSVVGCDQRAKSLRDLGDHLMKMNKEANPAIRDWTIDTVDLTTGNSGEANGKITGKLLLVGGETVPISYTAEWDDSRSKWNSPDEALLMIKIKERQAAERR